MDDKKFPRYLAAPIQVLWLDSDDIAIIFSLGALYLMFSSWLLLAAMVAVPWQYRRMKKRYPRGFFHHMLFRMGISKLKHYPLSFEKEFYE